MKFTRGLKKGLVVGYIIGTVLALMYMGMISCSIPANKAAGVLVTMVLPSMVIFGIIGALLGRSEGKIHLAWKIAVGLFVILTLVIIIPSDDCGFIPPKDSDMVDESGFYLDERIEILEEHGEAIDLAEDYIRNIEDYQKYNGRDLTLIDAVEWNCETCFSIDFTFVIDNPNPQIKVVIVKVMNNEITRVEYGDGQNFVMLLDK